MATPEKLRRELESVEKEIEDLWEAEYQVEAEFGPVRAEAGPLRALSVYLLRLGFRRRRQNLKVRRNMLRNCLDQVQRDESRRVLAGGR